MTGTDTAPPLNALVDLLPDRHQEWLASRVEDADDDGLLVAAPDDNTGLPAFVRPGEPVQVFWLAEDEPRELATVLAATVSSHLPCWRLVPTSPARRACRRAFFRVSLGGQVELLGAHAAGPAALIDLSEGGLRCHVHPGPAPATGELVEVAVDLGDQHVHATATVVRRRVHDLGQELSLRFDTLTASDGDAIRRRLFAEQRRLRAAGLV